jgi:condensin complex subunit 1
MKLVLDPCQSNRWFGFAEQAINAIYSSSEKPDTLCGEMLKRMACRVFSLPLPEDASVDTVASLFANNMNLDMEQDNDQHEIENDGNINENAETFHDETAPAIQGSQDSLVNTLHPGMCDAHELSKLCFMVGHIAIKQIVHLEAIESEWKRRKYLGMR